MYLLENGCMIVESPERRAERRLCNGLFLMLTGAFVLSIPAFANIFGIELRPTLEQLIAGFLIASAGLALIMGTILILRIPLKRPENYESHSVPEAEGEGEWKRSCRANPEEKQGATSRKIYTVVKRKNLAKRFNAEGGW